MVNKVEIRRVVFGKCVVAPPGEGSKAAAAPSQVTVSVRQSRGCCGLLAGSWKELAVFSFGDRPKAPYFSNAFLDLEHLFKYSRRADAGASQVKICVALRSGETRVARVDLDDFMGQLMQNGRPEWFFLYLHDKMVTLMQANIPLSNVPPEWPFDGMASDNRQGPKGEKVNTCDDPKVTGPEKGQENVIADQGVKDNADKNNDTRKADVFLPEDKESDVVENGKEIQEAVEAITVTDDLNNKEESGQEAEDSDDSDWEIMDEWIVGIGSTDEESDLDDDEGTDGDTDEQSERDSDWSGCETLKDHAYDNTAEGPGKGRDSFLARLGAACRHHRHGLLVAAATALVLLLPADHENWRWGGAGGEM